MNTIIYLIKVIWVMVLVSLAMSLLNIAVAYELPDDYAERLREQRIERELHSYPISGFNKNVPEPKRIQGYDPESYQPATYTLQDKSKAD